MVVDWQLLVLIVEELSLSFELQCFIDPLHGLFCLLGLALLSNGNCMGDRLLEAAYVMQMLRVGLFPGYLILCSCFLSFLKRCSEFFD